jgi:hypothetical protein
MQVTTLGIDLAKTVLQVHGVDQHGKGMLKKQLKRAQMAPFFINLPLCLVGIEACGSAHHWARKLQAIGHTVRFSRQDKQERRGRCGGDVRSCRAPEHALCAYQNVE